MTLRNYFDLFVFVFLYLLLIHWVLKGFERIGSFFRIWKVYLEIYRLYKKQALR